MGARDPFIVEWNDVEYSIQASKIMQTIERVEGATPLPLLVEWRFNPINTQASRLAKSYWIMLLEAGVPDVTWEDVYLILLSPEKSASVAAAVTNLLGLMLPPDHLSGENKGTPKKSTSAASSRKRTNTGSKTKNSED